MRNDVTISPVDGGFIITWCEPASSKVDGLIKSRIAVRVNLEETLKLAAEKLVLLRKLKVEDLVGPLLSHHPPPGLNLDDLTDPEFEGSDTSA